MEHRVDTDKSESTLLSEAKVLAEKFENDIEHFTLDYDELVDYFHTYVFELVNYSALNLYSNPLSKFIMRHLGEEIPGCIRDEFRLYEEDCSFQEEMDNLTTFYKDIITHGFGISDSEFEELYQLSLIDEENSNMYVSYLLSQLIEDCNNTSDSTYEDLINRFICDLIERNGLNIHFKIGKEKRDNNDDYADSICENGEYYVTFDRDHLDSKKVLFNLEDIFHEIWHTVQDSEEYNDPCVIELIKMDDFIRRELGDSYYDENYNYISYEVDANLHAVMMQTSLLKVISPASYAVNRRWLNRRIDRYSDLLYSRKRTYGGEEYDIDVLFDRAIAKAGKSREDVLGSSNEQKKYLKEIKFK